MRRGLLLLCSIVIAAACAASALAREWPSAEERAQKLTDKMKELLALTDEQVPKIHRINLDSARKVDEVAEKNQGNNPEMLKGLRQVNVNREGEYKKVLTDEQWKEFVKVREQLRYDARERLREARQKAKAKSAPDEEE